MESVAAVQARIATIEARLGVQPPAAPIATTASPASSLSFDQQLSHALGVTGAAQASRTPATLRSPGSYGRLQPPAELVHHGNGHVPADALVSIGGGHRLHAPAAAAYEQMVDAAAADGIAIGITDSYRDFHTQEHLARTKGLYSQGGLAATPGHSNHGWGLAVDLDLDARAQQWMRENGHRFGFVEDTPREPWHWTYRPD